jgi:Zn-dependent M28 family amino/carboxypeptidase
MGFQVEEQVFDVDGQKFKNLIARFGDSGLPKFVVGAHYDVCGDQPGADDNGSAVAGLLEVSRLVVEKKPKLSHQLEFVAYTLEEPPNYGTQFMGSYVHAKSLQSQKAKVKMMIVLEMIGFFSDEPNSQKFPAFFMKWFYPTVGNFIAIVGHMGGLGYGKRIQQLFMKNSSVPAYRLHAPKHLGGVDYSDHRSYWKFGYPALMITDTAFFRNYHYHMKTDTPETLDYRRMAEVVKGTYSVLSEY